MITPKIVIAYSQCKLQAYLLLFSDNKGVTHEYVSILENETMKNRTRYFRKIKNENAKVVPYTSDSIKNGDPILVNANLSNNELEAYTDVIVKIEADKSKKTTMYSPTLVVGTFKINTEQKLHLAFIGHILSNFIHRRPISGIIVGSGSSIHRVKLESLYKEVDSILSILSDWINDSKRTPPATILNKHCHYCAFQKECKIKAIENDDLSLLNRITLKDIQKYQSKGIFTVKQLSYLFKPRKQRKRKKKNNISLRYRPELQALAIRTGKIYIQEQPELVTHEVELYLDIEGIPDQSFFYLIGLIVSKGKEKTYYSYWADSKKDEQLIWNKFIERVNQYPNAPIYHYGAFDSKAIYRLNTRYGNINKDVENRLVNVNSFIYGKVYFPIYSNSLKELGKFIGANWSHPKASGLQSLVWRYLWNEKQNPKYQQTLLTYNKEDCNALCLLTTELFNIVKTANSSKSVDFADQPKKYATDIGNEIHKELELLLKYAHADYDKNKISLKSEKSSSNKKDYNRSKKISYGRLNQTPGKVIQVLPRRKCPRCKRNIIITEKTGEIIITDLVFSKNGCRKSITKYIGKKVYCKACQEFYNPKAIRDFKGKIFGHSFVAWVVYQRVVLRLPYEVITQVMEDMFTVRIAKSTVVKFIRNFAIYYSSTEKHLIKKILKSPFIHADETKINIQGEDHYVWVFTDGKHVVFRKTETRKSLIVHEFLSDYAGILITDFYPGYDSVKCRQQKCWSHLIRDINDDLWKDPFNVEFESFVLKVKDLIVPILQTVQKYGEKKRHLNKFRSSIEKFYRTNIEKNIYKFEVTKKYQKRFKRYKESLFVFLDEDGISWNNNMAERALRALAVQRKISGTFYDSLVSEYLLLLGMAQSCRFQEKPFLKFMLSQEMNIDMFKAPKPLKYSKAYLKTEE